MRARQAGVSLIEIVVVLGIFSLLVMGIFAFLEPRKQIGRFLDARRKRDFAVLERVFEDYYNDYQQYPPPGEICFSEGVYEEGGLCYCPVCGLSQGGFASYLNKLFCDPAHPQKEYLYQYPCLESNSQWYRLCASLNQNSEGGENLGGFYNYGVSSTNILSDDCLDIPPLGFSELPPSEPTASPPPAFEPTPTQIFGATPTPGPGFIPTVSPTPTALPLLDCPPDSVPKYCLTGTVDCNICGSFANCIASGSCDWPLQLYSDPACRQPCRIAEGSF
ncbi:prepilin-type N-terminal cleavage/methylation domain-containing protein [Candidatus Shapirobacteria bacterium]|nr:prepilin-type N-terminal cleavage/methylation domain-containing protein [Candidatus Shapirobacteria bacterium]